MFKNLRTSTKLFILCSMFIILVGVTTYGLVAEKQIAIKFAGKELVGNQYLTVLRGVYAAILTRRPRDEPAAQQSGSADGILKALSRAESDLGGLLQTAELERALAATLRELWSSKVEDENTDTLILDALAKARNLALRIGDDSNLTLDPDLDTYYLQNIVVVMLPTFLDQIGEMQALVRAAAAAGVTAGEDKVRLLVLDGLLRSTADAIRSNLEAAYRGQAGGSLKQTLHRVYATMNERTDSYLARMRTSVADGAFDGLDASAFASSYAGVVGKAIDAWSTAQTELDRLLRQRISGLRGKLFYSLMLIGVLGSLSILVAVMTHRHIVRPLERLEGIARTVRETKNYNLRIDHHNQDEIGRLAVAFNGMLSELAAAREREMSEHSEAARVSRLTTMGAMTASIAHEINQPLAAIVANGNAGLRWLANASPDLDEVRASLKRIVGDGHRASQVIGSIRAMFKKDSQERADVSLNDLVHEVTALVQAEIQSRRVTLKTELLQELPPVVADRVQLRQVFLNLMVNAIEAMGSVTHRARLLLVKSEIHELDGVLITVQDSGIGIGPTETERIFDAFFTTKSDGMGMGLAISRSIIEAHGGRLWASPGTPHGSVFYFVLPSGRVSGE
jgi:signal transduction histidine kinase